ncbi:uncharacterized protein LOC111063010 isoform X2 [Nilaparvata lugens]|uniref:uncharacterized protein LOC111063010 isoform X2 n=1 Tax=Nilaparvata lugens TaxID=108931 RepID=UPI00193D8540|nr:uncharacterized protein LOC111063010 isoform X2 [Nilaparvata lugens]
MSAVCGGCEKPLTADEKTLKCSGYCDHLYHLECASVSPADFEKITAEKKSAWQCTKCVNQKCSVCTKLIGQTESKIRCSGLCNRNFHVHCSGYKKLLGAADEKWQCVSCFDGPKCRVCDKPFKRRDKKILCTGVCQRFYHLSCLDIPVEAFEEQWSGKEDSWVCFPCQENTNKSVSIDSGKLDEKEKLKRDNKMLRSELKSINEVLVSLSTELVEQRRLVKEAESEVLNLSEAILVKQEEIVELHEALKSVGIKMNDRMKKASNNQIPLLKNNLNSQSNEKDGLFQEKKIHFNESNTNSVLTQTPKRYRQNYRGMKNTHRSDVSNELCLKMPSDTVVLHVESTSDSHARLKVRNPRVEPQISYCSHDMVCLKDSATQTDDEPPNPGLLEPDDYRVMRGGLSLPTSPEYSDRSRSPMKSPRVGKPTSEMYIRQYQYREELKKQIEERQKLEAERKERERLEEEAIERRVREQQEKLRRQYEIEEQERLDYIMRRHIQDDVLRQRLADIQQHDTREKPAGGKERMRPVTVTHCSKEDSNQVRAAEPGDPVCQLIESAENMLKAPLLADPACSAPLPPPLPPSPRLETHSVAGRRQADASPCRRQPVLKAVSPCVSVKPRSNNAQILDNKWQVPAVERSYIQPRSVLGNHADQVHSSPDNVLTQLSSFRRQLQMEHFRLNERMQQQSKRRSP